jgi:hypothetical protein
MPMQTEIPEVEISLEQKKEKRLVQFNQWLSDFKELSNPDNEVFSYSQNAAERLNDWYWTRRETDIIPYMEADNSSGETVIRINRYKVISNLELSVVGFQPILHDDESARSELNAALAWYISIRTLIEWNGWVEETERINELIDNITDLKEFVDEHINWLAKLDVEFSYPVFSNSHTWWNFSHCLTLYLKNNH